MSWTAEFGQFNGAPNAGQCPAPRVPAVTNTNSGSYSAEADELASPQLSSSHA